MYFIRSFARESGRRVVNRELQLLWEDTCASRAATGMPLSITAGGTGACTSVRQPAQHHLPRTCHSMVNTPGV